MFRLTIVLLSLITLSSCSKISGDGEGPEVRLRVSNVSKFDFDQVIIYQDTLGKVKANSKSPYYSRKPAYRYASFLVLIDTLSFAMIPDDYVGEEPLKKGHYTFEINLDSLSRGGQITQRLIKD